MISFTIWATLLFWDAKCSLPVPPPPPFRVSETSQTSRGWAPYCHTETINGIHTQTSGGGIKRFKDTAGEMTLLTDQKAMQDLVRSVIEREVAMGLHAVAPGSNPGLELFPVVSDKTLPRIVNSQLAFAASWGT